MSEKAHAWTIAGLYSLILLVHFFFHRWIAITMGAIFIAQLIRFRKVTFSVTKGGLLMGLFYLSFALSIFLLDGGNYVHLEQKLLFLALPVLFAFKPKFNKAQENLVLGSFILSSLFFCTFILLRNFLFPEYSTAAHFSSVEFTFPLHRSYLSLSLNISISLLLFRLLFGKPKQLTLRIVYLLLVLFLTIFTVLVSSKAALLALACTFLLFLFFKRGRKSKKMITCLVLLVMLAFSALLMNKGSKDRITSTISTLKTNRLELYKKYKNTTASTPVRIFTWGTAIDLIKERPLIGFGPTTGKNRLVQGFEKRDLQGAAKAKLNCHNQFLETWLCQGLIGLLILLGILSYFTIKGVQKKNLLLINLILISLLNFLVESMLERQAGVFLFCFFLLFFSSITAGEDSSVRST